MYQKTTIQHLFDTREMAKIRTILKERDLNLSRYIRQELKKLLINYEKNENN